MPTAADHARALHGLIEPLHAVLYFAPDVNERWEGLGLEPRAQGYVAGRSAPLGAVGPAVAAPLFFNFNRALFDFTLPAVWDIASPATVLTTRAEGIEALFTRIDAPTDGLAEATGLARTAIAGALFVERPLASANAAVAAPGTPFADLWQALTVLREHRGDGHVALLTASGLAPVDVLIVYAAWQGMVSRRFLQTTRLWDDDAWAAGEGRLRERGWLDDEGRLTAAGAAWRDEVEASTDRLAAGPYEALGAAGAARLFELLRPVADALVAAQVYPREPQLPEGFPA
jgi:hypothetical protein